MDLCRITDFYHFCATPGYSGFKPLHKTFSMAERQQRQRLRALHNCQLARFVQEGRATGKQLGTGSYGSVEEVYYIGIIMENHAQASNWPGNLC